METGEALMLQFRSGDRAGFEELYARYRAPLYGFFRRRLDRPARAEELSQETFLAVIQGADRYEPRATFRTYLYATALKLLAGERRKLRRDPPPVEEETRAGFPEESLWVREALEKLPASDREILMLREYEQLSYAEIAALLRLPLAAVRSRLFRSRIALRNQLRPEVQPA